MQKDVVDKIYVSRSAERHNRALVMMPASFASERTAGDLVSAAMVSGVYYSDAQLDGFRGDKVLKYGPRIGTRLKSGSLNQHYMMPTLDKLKAT